MNKNKWLRNLFGWLYACAYIVAMILGMIWLSLMILFFEKGAVMNLARYVANLVDKSKRVRTAFASILAIIAIIPAMSVWVQIGQIVSLAQWRDINFLLLYWAIVAVIAVIAGTAVGLINRFNRDSV